MTKSMAYSSTNSRSGDSTGVTAPNTPLAVEDPAEAASAGADLEPDAEVDARGHRCPMPLLMAKRGLNSLESGQILRLLSTDPGSAKDFELFARQSGHQIVAATDSSDEYHFLLQKA